MEKYRDEIIKFLSGMEGKVHSGFSIDCVIFSFHEGKIKILLNRILQVEKWILPGGYMFINDPNAEYAAHRILKDRTGIDNAYLKQFHLFSELNRVDHSVYTSVLKQLNVPEEYTDWLSKRHISLGYYSFVKHEKVVLVDTGADICEWFDLDNIPPLVGDHRSIILKALENVELMNEFIPVGYGLLPEKFTIVELRKLHEELEHKTLDRRNFQKKVLSTGYIIKLDERRVVNTYPHPVLFRYDMEKLRKIKFFEG